MGILITLVLALSVIYLVVRELTIQNGDPQVPCVCQWVCDCDVVDNSWRTIAIENEEDIKARQLEDRRREYREWVDNCNHVFEKGGDTTHDGKVCSRVIGEVA